MSDNQKHFAARVASVGGWTMVSRILGFIRDLLMAGFLGASFAADAFFIAFKLPNFFRRLFAEGAFSAGFVPLFARYLAEDEKKGATHANRFARDVLGWLSTILFFLVLAVEIAMPWVMQGLTGGYSGNSAKFDLVVSLGRLTFPYLFFISLAAMASGMLNTYGRFAAAAFAPVLLNILMITALVAAPMGAETKATWLAGAVALAGAAQLLWLVRDMGHIGVRFNWRLPRLTNDVKAMFALIGPAALGAGITQINLLVDVFLAARFLVEGAVSWLFYADRLSQLTVGVVGVALGTVLLPALSKALAADKTDEAQDITTKALVLGLLLALPATGALMAVPDALVRGLFERAAFGAYDTAMVAGALFAYAAGLPAFVLIKVLTPGFLARRDTKTPVRLALIALAVNLAGNLVLIGPMGHIGLAIATSAAAWVNAGLQMGILIRREHFHLPKSESRILVAMGAATVTMTASLATTAAFAGPLGDRPVIMVTVLVAVGVASYALSLWVFGIRRTTLKSLLR